MDNSLGLSQEVFSYLSECDRHDTKYNVVAKRLTASPYFVPDKHPLYENDVRPDKTDGRIMRWYEGEEHIWINVKGKPRLKKHNFQSTENKRNEERFINGLVAVRRLYTYRHKRHPSAPLLEDNRDLLVKVAIEFAAANFDVDNMPLSALMDAIVKSLKRNWIANDFIDNRQRRYTKDDKVLSPDKKKALIAEKKKLDCHAKALRAILAIVDAGKADATLKEQAESIGRGEKTLSKWIGWAEKDVSDKALGKQFTKEQLRKIRLYLLRNARHDNGVYARGKSKQAEHDRIVALLDFGESVAENRERIGAELGRTIPRSTFYDILKANDVPTTKFKNTKHIKK